MADGRYVRMVLCGGRPAGNFVGEIWQTGISLVDQSSGGLFPGAVKAALPTFPTQVIGQSGSDATWNWDLAWKGTDKFTEANLLALAGHALTFWNAVKSYAPTDSRLEEVRISAFDTAGDVIGGANVYSLKTPVAGTSTASAQLPAQIAVTASLRTGARGPAGRGRMYLPLNGATPTSGINGPATRDAVGNATKALVENIRAVGPLAAVVNKIPLTYSDIDDVQMGNYFDIQRRRESAKDEVYTSYTPSLT